MFDASAGFYARSLRFVLRHQGITLLVAFATLVLTVVLYVYAPKGFFPVQDTGLLLGISEVSPRASFSALADRQQALARIILKDPAVEGLTSFIGIDGTNLTTNTGRMQIALKPLEQRGASAGATDVIRRLGPKLADEQGIRLYMQPVQDLTVEDRVSRTQYQFTLQSADGQALRTWAPRVVEALRALPDLADVASDQQDGGLAARLALDRASASRLGITPLQIDNTLYDAFGQRQISTIFTQVNQYRVVLEAQPSWQRGPAALEHIYIATPDGGQTPLGAIAHVTEESSPLAISRQGQFPVVTISFNLAPGASLGSAVRAIRAATASLAMPAERAGLVSGHRRSVRALARQRAAADPRGDHHGLHRARRALRELHPSAHDSLDASVSRRRRHPRADAHRHGAGRHHADRHHPADRHRQEERDHDDRLRARRRTPRRHAAGGGDLSGVPAPLPADHDDDDGGAVWRGAAGVEPRDRAGSCGGRWASRSSAACSSARR